MACPYLGTLGTFFWGAVGRAELRAAVVKKIRAYKRPLVVVTEVPSHTPDFEALAEALYGSESLQFDRASGDHLASSRAGGLLVEDGEDGDLIRKYLVGVLGVTLHMPSVRVLHLMHQALRIVAKDTPPPPEDYRYRLRFHFFHAQPNQGALADALHPIPQCILQRSPAGFEISVVGDAGWSAIPGDGG